MPFWQKKKSWLLRLRARCQIYSLVKMQAVRLLMLRQQQSITTKNFLSLNERINYLLLHQSDLQLTQAYKFDLFSSSSVFGLVEPLSFCHKAENVKEFIEFSSPNLDLREESMFLVYFPGLTGKTWHFWAETFTFFSCYISILLDP